VIRRKPAGFLGAWFFIILSVTSSFMPFSDLAYEHRMYLPLAAIAVAVVVGGFELAEYLLKRFSLDAQRQKEVGRLIAMISITLIIASLGFLTILRNMDYYSPLVMWKDVVAKRPENSRAYINVGKILAERGQIEEALEYFYQAVRYSPNYVVAHSNLGQALIRLGRVEEGKAHLVEALRLRPNYEYALYNLGGVAADEGKLDEAIRYFSETLAINPNHDDAYFEMGKALEKQGKNSEAIKYYRRALQLTPQWPEALSSLALILTTTDSPEARDTNEAIRLAEMAVNLTGGQNADMLENLAVIYSRSERLSEAVETTRTAYEVALRSGDQQKATQIEARLQSYQTGRASDGRQLSKK
jgi:tetratricopeptide (TPR) repeat protein